VTVGESGVAADKRNGIVEEKMVVVVEGKFYWQV
jgi:hypothetical protein